MDYHKKHNFERLLQLKSIFHQRRQNPRLPFSHHTHQSFCSSLFASETAEVAIGEAIIDRSIFTYNRFIFNFRHTRNNITFNFIIICHNSTPASHPSTAVFNSVIPLSVVTLFAKSISLITFSASLSLNSDPQAYPE